MVDRINFIANYYGIQHQLLKTLEELAELRYEVIESVFAGEPSENLACELADVLIMLEQIMVLLNNRQQVAEAINFKLERQINRIEEEKKNEK